MKQLTMKITETNMNPLEAYAIAKTSQSVSAKDYREIPFKAVGYVVTLNTITDTDEKTGEVTTEEMECISIKTDDGVIIGTNSKVVKNSFMDIMSNLTAFGIDVAEQPLKIVAGEGTNGTFNTVEIVL